MGVGLDRGHAYVPAPPLSTVADSVRATMYKSTSATATPVPVSHLSFNYCFHTTSVISVPVYRFLLFCGSVILHYYVLVSGNWGPWSSWGSCSKTCNGGQMRRHRTCDNPSPAYGGRACAGADTQIQRCSTVKCPGESACLRQGSGVIQVPKMLLTEVSCDLSVCVLFFSPKKTKLHLKCLCLVICLEVTLVSCPCS